MDSWVVTILTFFFILVGVIMTFFILLQEGKGGGLAALGGTKAAGVEGVTNPIRRATAYLAGLFFALAIILGVISKPVKVLGLGVEKPPVTEGAGATEKKAETTVVVPAAGDSKPAEAPKAEEPKKAGETPAAPAEPKTDAAPKAEEKKSESPKTETAPPAVEVKKPEEPKKD